MSTYASILVFLFKIHSKGYIVLSEFFNGIWCMGRWDTFDLLVSDPKCIPVVFP